MSQPQAASRFIESMAGVIPEDGAEMLVLGLYRMIRHNRPGQGYGHFLCLIEVITVQVWKTRKGGYRPFRPPRKPLATVFPSL